MHHIQGTYENSLLNHSLHRKLISCDLYDTSQNTYSSVLKPF